MRVLLAIALGLLAARLVRDPEGAALRKRLERHVKRGRGGASRAFGLAVLRNRMNRLASSRPLLASLDRELLEADFPLRAGEFLLLSLALGASASLLLLAFRGGALAFVIFPFSFVAMRRWVRRRGEMRRARFEGQLPEVLTSLVQAIRAGHTVEAAVRHLGGVREPAGKEFRRVSAELAFGVPFEEAMQHLLARMPVRSLASVVAVLNIVRRTGGNPADFLEAQAELLRARIRYRQQVMALTAQQRLSAAVIGLLPAFVAGALTVVSPGYLSPLVQDPVGRIALAVAGGLAVIGWRYIQIAIRGTVRP